MPTPDSDLTVLAPTGEKLGMMAPPSELPSDLIPGEFLMLPDSDGRQQWYIYADKQRFWNGTKFVLTGTIIPFDPFALSEPEAYALRRRYLGQMGWI